MDWTYARNELQRTVDLCRKSPLTDHGSEVRTGSIRKASYGTTTRPASDHGQVLAMGCFQKAISFALTGLKVEAVYSSNRMVQG